MTITVGKQVPELPSQALKLLQDIVVKLSDSGFFGLLCSTVTKPLDINMAEAPATAITDFGNLNFVFFIICLLVVIQKKKKNNFKKQDNYEIKWKKQ
ncbi:hypothetical protein [Anditalea andensis]|uniref:Uncharacterized protein n=1 Tax=Anditalea andensis TaxID=1048983 RepID=A0A074KYI4_9BACT|nr:hypothetical protein [Anditalea andensis]KEO73285.1 hypothetical protein EL17_13125 [Anditalea andensis]